MTRPTSDLDRSRHDGACAASGGPLRLTPPAAAPIDPDAVDLAIARLRARLDIPS